MEKFIVVKHEIDFNGINVFDKSQYEIDNKTKLVEKCVTVENGFVYVVYELKSKANASFEKEISFDDL